MESLRQDVRYAVRQLLGSPGFTVVAVSRLALGIGANTAVFCVMTTIALRSLPVSHPQAVFIRRRNLLLHDLSSASGVRHLLQA